VSEFLDETNPARKLEDWLAIVWWK